MTGSELKLLIGQHMTEYKNKIITKDDLQTRLQSINWDSIDFEGNESLKHRLQILSNAHIIEGINT